MDQGCTEVYLGGGRRTCKQRCQHKPVFGPALKGVEHILRKGRRNIQRRCLRRDGGCHNARTDGALLGLLGGIACMEMDRLDSGDGKHGYKTEQCRVLHDCRSGMNPLLEPDWHLRMSVRKILLYRP